MHQVTQEFLPQLFSIELKTLVIQIPLPLAPSPALLQIWCPKNQVFSETHVMDINQSMLVRFKTYLL